MFKCNKFWHKFKGNKKKNQPGFSGPGCGGCAYFLAFLGALAYYWSTAPNLWEAFVGFFKAVLWPAFLVYGLMVFAGI